MQASLVVLDLRHVSTCSHLVVRKQLELVSLQKGNELGAPEYPNLSLTIRGNGQANGGVRKRAEKSIALGEERVHSIQIKCPD